MTAINEAFGNDPSVSLTNQIGQMAARLETIAGDLGKAKDEDTARFDALRTEQATVAATLTELKSKHDAEIRDTQVSEAIALAAEWKAKAGTTREPSMVLRLGEPAKSQTYADQRGAFLASVFMANHRDSDVQRQGKAKLAELGLTHADALGVSMGESIGKSQGDTFWGKSTLGTSDATGGWVVPNAIVDEFIKPATVDNPYRTLMTWVSGVTASAVDIPFRSGLPTRAAIAAFGATKDNNNLAYNGYTATMYTLAAIYDIGNQFLRQSRGAAEQDVMQELATAFSLGEAYYVREGSGSSQPYGYTPALTNGPGAYRSTFTPSATTLAGSIATSVATAAGALAARGQKPTGAVLSAAAYWTMLSQGTDTAGFFFAPAAGPTAIRGIDAGTLVSPFGIPVYPDASADIEGAAAVVDNLVVANWKKFKVFTGENYRVDSSDQAGTRWDTNLTGFRGEEEMAFDARPAVYSGAAQLITDVTP